MKKCPVCGKRIWFWQKKKYDIHLVCIAIVLKAKTHKLVIALGNLFVPLENIDAAKSEVEEVLIKNKVNFKKAREL